MKKTLLSLMILGQFITSVQAKEACNPCVTVECHQRQMAHLELSIQEIEKKVTPKLTGILKTGVSQYEAKRICQDMGMRLPTARELALVSQNLGAQGISETQKDRHYYLVKGSDSAGNPDHFYFSFKGYNPPAGDLGTYTFWTSSVHPTFFHSAYLLDASVGVIESIPRGDDFSSEAVRCVKVRAPFWQFHAVTNL